MLTERVEIKRKLVAGIMLSLLLMGMLTLAFNIQPAKARGPIFIRADGSVEPERTPISSIDNITYTFTDDITYWDGGWEGIVVEKSDITVDGNGYRLIGGGDPYPGFVEHGFSLVDINNVTIQNIGIRVFTNGVYIVRSSNIIVAGNNIGFNFVGVSGESSSNNSVYGNNISGTNPDHDNLSVKMSDSTYNTISGNILYAAIRLTNCCHNSISENYIAGTGVNDALEISSSSSNIVFRNNMTAPYSQGCTWLRSSFNNVISGNNIKGGTYCIAISESSFNNTISGNNVDCESGIANPDLIRISESSNNRFYHNNFFAGNVACDSSPNVWDDGYPSGGNYWSSYEGSDLYKGPFQNETGSDGMGDTPYIIDESNQDNYPLIQLYNGPVRNLDTGQSYPTIQMAINNATEGHRIFVLSGVYYENVVVNKIVSLIGENEITTIINGNGTGTVVLITENNVGFEGFTVQNSGNLRWDCGIYLLESFYNYLANNTVRNNNNGMHIVGGSNVLRNNKMANNTYDFGVWGDSLSDFTQDIDTSNKVNGKPIYFYVNRNSETVPEDVGYLGIVNSQNITVSNLNISNNGEGILLAYSTDSVIEKVNISNNRFGIYLFSSSMSLLNENVMSDNEVGVYLSFSWDNVIEGNVIRGLIGQMSYGIEIHTSNSNSINGNIVRNASSAGIGIWGSNGVEVLDNEVEKSRIGIVLDSQNTLIVRNIIWDSYEGMEIQSGSHYNTLYHNNFINNTMQLRFTSPYSFDDIWDNGYEGNYWGDYVGIDDGSGVGRFGELRVALDGIGDTNIPHLEVDWYPLMNPWTLTPPVVTATIDIIPDTLNLKSQEQWNSAYIELPRGYHSKDIDVSTLRLNGEIPAESSEKKGKTLIVKFGRATVEPFIYDQGIRYANVALTITGALFDGTSFEGTDIIFVNYAGDINNDGVMNIVDQFIIGKRYGATIGEPTYEEEVDLNTDGIIDRADLVIFAINYGATIPE